MNISISKNDVIWSYLGYILKLGANIILLPVILKKLPTSELGVWYVFLAIGALAQLMDFGLTPTIMRNISYAFGGATTLQKEGIDQQQQLTGEPNYQLIFKLIYASKKLYLYISVLALLLMSSMGTCYLLYITRSLDNGKVLIAWIIYMLGVTGNFYYSYWVPVLSGVGRIKESQQAVVISQVCYVTVGSLGIILSYGLVALAVAFCLSGIVLRGVSKYYFMQQVPQSDHVAVSRGEYKELFVVIWHTASKMGIVSLGAFLILQANTFICSIFFDLKTTAEYGLTLQLISMISFFSTIMLRSYLPIINEARLRNDTNTLKAYLSFVTVIGWGTFLFAAVILALFGHEVLAYLGTKTELLPQNMLIFMLIYLFLEFNHSNCATFILTKNKVPFVKASIVSGVGIVLLSLLLIKITSRSFWSLLIAQAIVQAMYNNWKWPVYVMQELEISLLDVIGIGCKKILQNIMLVRRF